ncbi:MAG: AAA family ATPase [Pseudomonadota bacterium]
MKLRAIRVQEFRKFSEPVRIDGLSGGLDVLAAPNEDGKSTLFEAVRWVINEKYGASSGSKKMRSIMPYAGGAPLIEIDFDLAGRMYRLRKQYVKKPDAILIDRDTGRDIARKDDVEHWLDDNLKARLPFGLFWVAQHGTAQRKLLEETASEHAPALRSAVEAEVGAIAGGAARDSVRASLTDDLAALINAKSGTPKKNGAYDRVVRARDAAAEALQDARRRRESAEERYTRLEAIRGERAALLDDVKTHTLATTLEQARAAVEAARHANQQLREARAEEEASRHLIAAALQQRDAFEARGRDFDALADAQRAAQEKAEACEARLNQAEVKHADAEAALKACDTQLVALRVEERNALIAAQRAALDEGITRRRAVLGDVQAAISRIEETKEFLASEPVTAEAVERLQGMAGEISQIALLIEQQIPKITVHYDDGRDGTVHAGGQTLAGGLVRPISERTELTLDGIGRMIVDPGSGRDRTHDADDLKALQADRDALMVRLGVGSLKEAQARARDRQARETAASLDGRRLADLAPGGVTSLEHALAEDEAKRESLPQCDETTPLRPRDAIANDIAAAESERAERQAATARTRAAREEARIANAKIAADLASRAERLEQIADSLERDTERNRIGRQANAALLAEAVAAAELRASAAVRSVSAWQESYVNDEALGVLNQKLEAAQAEADTAEAAVRTLDAERGEHLAVLRETMQDGIDEVIAACENRLAETERDVEYYEQRIAGLKLLADTLDHVAEETRETYTRPVVQRMAPYVDTIFPGANLSFTEDFTASDILRNGAAEDFADVSMGTQEQIGVLIRLGFARLFADRGQPLPLILDDALVYSDDHRIERMFEALRIAAQSHQVLILTCRTRAFERLGGERLAIEAANFA